MRGRASSRRGMVEEWNRADMEMRMTEAEVHVSLSFSNRDNGRRSRVLGVFENASPVVMMHSYLGRAGFPMDWMRLRR